MNINHPSLLVKLGLDVSYLLSQLSQGLGKLFGVHFHMVICPKAHKHALWANTKGMKVNEMPKMLMQGRKDLEYVMQSYNAINLNLT